MISGISPGSLVTPGIWSALIVSSALSPKGSSLLDNLFAVEQPDRATSPATTMTVTALIDERTFPPLRR
ncbi:MAG: hypothetical protein FWG16_06985 [Micrococcales bacterium]|nr:hypothetical protein [Micrococcales bacterium]